MAMKILYYIIFGIITFTNGKPAVDKPDTYFVKDEFELQKLLQTLANQGKLDVGLTQHEDGPSTHREDQARINRDDKPRPLRFHSDKASYEQYYPSRENVGEKRQNELQLINQMFAKNVDKYPGLKNGQNVLEDLLQAFRANDNNENADDVVDFLGEVQKSLADDGSYVSQLRCAGNRCQDKRINDDDRDDLRYNVRDDRGDDRDDLRCNGKNCARSKDDNEINFADDRNNNNLLCIGDKCTRIESNNDPNDSDVLRCHGKNCARSRYDNKENNLRYNSMPLAKKIKISDDLDAVVLGMSDVDHLLTNLNAPRQQRASKLTSAKLLENVDLDRFLNTKSVANKKSNVEAVVFDLTQVENGDAVAKQIKQVLSQNDNQSEDDYDEYGNLVEEHLKRGVYNMGKPVKSARGTSKILPHNEENNNVYVPQWLLDEVISKTNVVRAPNDAQLLKSVFPLTKQQKERIKAGKRKKGTKSPRKVYRRNFDQDVGVPFHLEVQGLGQVNP